MKDIKLNALTNVLVRVLNIVFPLITAPYISRVLDKTAYGNFNVSNTLINVFIPFATLGIYNYGIREISKLKGKPDDLNQKFSQLFYVLMISTGISTVIYYLYIFHNDTGHLTLMYAIMGIQIFAQVFYIEWLNEAFENYKFILYKTLVIRIIMLVSIFLFVKTENDIIPYTMIMSVTTLLNYVLSFIWIKKEVRFVKVSLRELKKLIAPLFATLLIANANMLYTTLDQLFLSKISLPEQVTYYMQGYNLATLLARVISGAVSVSVPRLGYYLGQNDRKAYEDLVNKGSRAFNFFLIPMGIGLAVVGTQATLIYGGEKYLLAGICTSLFAIRTIGWASEIIFGTQIIMVNGYEKKLTLLYFIGGGTNFALNLVLYFFHVSAPEYYILTTMVAELVLLFVEYRFIKKHNLMNMKTIFRNTAKYLMICLGFLPIAFIVNQLLPYANVVNMRLILNAFTIVILCVLYYMTVLLCLKDSLMIFMLEQVKKIFWRRRVSGEE
ncbi:MAG: oligosaccharide flippase family protein [Eubacteriales bacterium]|nr:oligosaccharide flippase family protein [Eubacteriales bacterium]